jgi:hypothetical protein
MEVLNRMQMELKFLRSMKKRKMEHADHALRGTSGPAHQQLLEGRVEEKRRGGRPNRTWTDDIFETDRAGKPRRSKKDHQRRARDMETHGCQPSLTKATDE